MKLASKLIASLALIASFSSYAADIDAVVTLSSDPIADFSTAAELAALGEEGAVAIITQSGEGSIGLVTQTGANSAVVNQTVDDTTVVIIQGGSSNFAGVIQSAVE